MLQHRLTWKLSQNRVSEGVQPSYMTVNPFFSCVWMKDQPITVKSPGRTSESPSWVLIQSFKCSVFMWIQWEIVISMAFKDVIKLELKARLCALKYLLVIDNTGACFLLHCCSRSSDTRGYRCAGTEWERTSSADTTMEIQCQYALLMCLLQQNTTDITIFWIFITYGTEAVSSF